MANNTWGDWSDGVDDDFLVEIDEWSEDNDPTPAIGGERGNNQDEQTGRGVKRKAENQNEEQEQDYYRIKPVRDHHSDKFNMTAKNYSVHFNNRYGSY